MGIDFAMTSTSSMLERRLAELRDTVRKGDTARRQVLKKHVLRMIKVLDKDLQNLRPIVDEERFGAEHRDQLKALARALTPGFWRQFDSFIARFDVSVRVLTFLSLRAYYAGHLGKPGELVLGDLAFPGADRAMARKLITGDAERPIPPQLFDLGLWISVDL